MRQSAPIWWFLLLLFTLSGQLPAQETTVPACTDGIDNDGDGLTDCDDPDCDRVVAACVRCGETSSFADSLIAFRNGCGRSSANFGATIGVADFYPGNANNLSAYVITGEGGWVRLAFTDNLLINSGDDAPDVHVFEVTDRLQLSQILVRPYDVATRDRLRVVGVPEEDGYFLVGTVGPLSSSLDIDAALPVWPRGSLRFDAVEVRDVDDGNCAAEETPGADIDAVCALSSLPLIDCAGTPLGSATTDGCGQCLDRNDPRRDESCRDCAGTIYGRAVTDDCGDCRLPEDPAFNSGCTDCAGVLNGTAVVDSCGDCRSPQDPAFNAGCTDCNGQLFGPARLDPCGDCVDTTSVRFGLACRPPRELYVPGAFSPNGDGVNDYLRIMTAPGLAVDLLTLEVYDRWGGRVFRAAGGPVTAAGNRWDGTRAGRPLPTGQYVYYLRVRYADDPTEELRRGVVVLLR